jgi:ketosteroid isomerase-like protein
MSQENVGVVRRSFEVWNRQDMLAYVALYGPDAQIDWSRSRSPFKGVYRGHPEIESFWDVFWSTWENVQLEVHSYTQADSEVMAWNTAHMRGREGIEVTARTALVFTVENGQITCLRLFDEQAEALEALGLSE